MGEVYLAQDTKLERKVAVKILLADVASNHDRMERFVREAKAAAALNHPHIAHIYEIGESDGTYYIAMEFIDGMTLREKIHRQQTELPKLLRYLQHVAEGPAKAHAVGIVHRDLKPSFHWRDSKTVFRRWNRNGVVAKGNLRYPQLSPDGKFVAYFFDGEQTSRPGIAIIEFVSGALVDTFDLPVTSQSNLYESLFYRGFHWSPDGRAIIYLNTLEGVSNLWSQPIDGGAAKQITDFKSDLIYNFAYSPDGNQLAVARGNHTRDAVLISEVK